jgi:anti-sigma-K factor RskA
VSEHDHEPWADDLAAYLLGALEAEEVAQLEHHLEGCERCRAEMRWLGPAVESLPESVPRQDPPPTLRKRLLAEVRVKAAAEARSAPGFQRTAGWLRGLGSGPLGWKPAVAIGAVALALVAVAGYQAGGGGSGGERTSMISAGQAPGVTATMVSEGDGGTLRLAHVRQLPDDRVLEAWVRRDGKIEAVPALFVPDRDGRASTTIADMRGVDTVMVTAEPKGGSEQPTGEPIVTLPVPQ